LSDVLKFKVWQCLTVILLPGSYLIISYHTPVFFQISENKSTFCHRLSTGPYSRGNYVSKIWLYLLLSLHKKLHPCFSLIVCNFGENCLLYLEWLQNVNAWKVVRLWPTKYVLWLRVFSWKQTTARWPDPHFSVSALLMYGMVYDQTLILAHLKVLPAQLNSRIYLYFKSVIISSFLRAECVMQTL